MCVNLIIAGARLRAVRLYPPSSSDGMEDLCASLYLRNNLLHNNMRVTVAHIGLHVSYRSVRKQFTISYSVTVENTMKHTDLYALVDENIHTHM